MFESLVTAGLGTHVRIAEFSGILRTSPVKAAPNPPPNPNDGTTPIDPGNMQPIKPGSFNVDNGLTSGLSKIVGIGAWIVLALCVVGVLMCAAQMAIARKNGGEAAVIGLVWALVACIIAGSASGIVAMATG
ncbi:hypothetical protein GCM10023205_84810 [Yinghuangia aomiensis]|uniref:TrbC/VIRB2 family protein n=1 Tax=Yinghuangia aomiensis TaxID=676205 RepID=A0ABP9IJ45_9ACTN